MFLSFREYLESKSILRTAAEDAAKIKKVYQVNKYCKIPVCENLDDDHKIYIALKPKDVIEIIWEQHDDKLIARFLSVDERGKFFPTWTTRKFQNWVDSTCNLL